MVRALYFHEGAEELHQPAKTFRKLLENHGLFELPQNELAEAEEGA